MKTKLIFVLLVVFSLTLFNCSEDANTEAEGTGKLMVRLTDAPFPYDMVAEANVTIFKVDARRKSGNESDETSSESDDMSEMENGSPFVLLMEEEIDVNLLDLTDGTTEMLANLDVPAGTYDLVRVYVRGVNVVLTDERVFDLKVPLSLIHI